MTTHEHRFTPFRQHFGQYGPQDVHYHPCIEVEDCVLMADTRECAGQMTGTHYRAELTEDGPRKALA